jgi:hypothetical protein
MADGPVSRASWLARAAMGGDMLPASFSAGQANRSKALLSAPRRNSAWPAARKVSTPDRGCERAGGGAGCHADSGHDSGCGDGSGPGYIEGRSRRPTDWSACAARKVRRTATAGRWLLSTQVVGQNREPFLLQIWAMDRTTPCDRFAEDRDRSSALPHNMKE